MQHTRYRAHLHLHVTHPRIGLLGCDLPEGLEEHTEFGATEMPSTQHAARPTFKEIEFEKEVEELADGFSPGPRGRREAV